MEAVARKNIASKITFSRAEYRTISRFTLNLIQEASKRKTFEESGIDTEKSYTYADYASWGENVPNCELIDGMIYDMAAPTLSHQDMVGNLYYQLREFLKGKTCRVFISPVDVRLDYDKDDKNILQPDVIVVCDPKKIENGKHVLGAPDLVIEVLSPSTAGRDLMVKMLKYEKHGVREYWLVDPDSLHVQVMLFEGGKRDYKVYAEAEKIPVTILDGFEIEL